MKLADYLSRENLKPSNFADTIGVPASTITRILKGERSPGLDVMRKIADATAGDVSALDDFVPPSDEASEPSASQRA